jgi:ribulose-5-phosphate 4-epimerase/fuculose-1-phosphate aldolase
VKAAIHRNHGLLTAGHHSIDSAAFWFIALERCCRQQPRIEATGRPPVLVPPERAAGAVGSGTCTVTPISMLEVHRAHSVHSNGIVIDVGLLCRLAPYS